MEALRRTPAAAEDLQRLLAGIETVILGKREAVVLCLVGLLAEGHVLIEDVPGTGKTTLAKALARSIDARFSRIQFTSDLLPADVLGVRVWASEREQFAFRPGPVFANVVLADELNRTTPRTQSALLESMSERQVSLDGITKALPRPFLVVATQNPLEFEGTYPLPESQLDRFLLRVRVGFPAPADEERMLLDRVRRDPLESLRPALDLPGVLGLIEAARAVRVEPELVRYALALVGATRSCGRFLHGASPRASLALFRAAQALALLEGRGWCVPDDVKRLAVPVLAHRLAPSPLLARRGSAPGSDELVAELVEELPVPA